MNDTKKTGVTPNANRFYHFIKRLADIVISFLGLIILSPAFLIIALAIVIEDPGPAFFSQKRAGLKNKTFTMYKFRSMIKDAPDLREKMEVYNELDGPAFKMKDDPRITRVGRFIRRTSLDELPQLFNVLRGDMSLVGPRPLPTYESEQLNGYQLQRLLVKPGITCYWQINGRSDISFDEWMEMDLSYIRSQGLWTDFLILARTFKAVFKAGGAY